MTKILHINGMTCGHCTARVEKALRALDAVSTVTMDLEGQSATIVLSSVVLDEALVFAVTEAGYEVVGLE